ncbi:NAD-dependent epimerase/dehydratase family protein [Agrobacterium vitis]|uniref:NAD-dependent epimerase/dehydratase family protein n=1 Tax=Agrobacterium vitis TaxID=373 RepID=A0AAE4WEW7_AGRVI|nr:GDP-mannose 4,6-dehydratase [Agrobacterium vitis]MCF1500087.1 NAD-dependent epimerase/dehydratase family protein [Allorhizobium sp. Av2]MCM2442228.1 NAD-dependent epimerase/dehydratase family protein [Agrobacterium vitis]MUZ58638.1 NAD-dependent epimerase/dehydratase family protein [Agrobacterium vitis]MVA66273.1 NAD-dependent epimerase/dehydratase family protein [Agrobacterium vitis]MVA88310.1 NAD-dependent epimerase/dehydratase family protein [Agrobacterium vitis]
MRELIVTGGAGFVGANLIRFALEQGRKVYCLDVGDRFSRIFGTDIMDHPKFEIIAGNLADGIPEDRLPNEATCVHLAALAHVDYSMHNPSETFTNNILATINIFETARRKGWRVIFGSSVETYGTEVSDIITEVCPLNPLSPYGASKVACESVAQSFQLSFGVQTSTVRFTNLYGPWQLPDRIIPRLIAQSILGLPGEVDQGRVRDYLYVGDVIAAIMQIDANEIWGEVFNISSGEGVSNYMIADLVDGASSKQAFIHKRNERGNDGRGASLVSSSMKLQGAIEWAPHKSIEDGITETYTWYMQNTKWLEQFSQLVSEPRTSNRFIADFVFPLTVQGDSGVSQLQPSA